MCKNYLEKHLEDKEKQIEQEKQIDKEVVQ